MWGSAFKTSNDFRLMELSIHRLAIPSTCPTFSSCSPYLATHYWVDKVAEIEWMWEDVCKWKGCPNKSLWVLASRSLQSFWPSRLVLLILQLLIVSMKVLTPRWMWEDVFNSKVSSWNMVLVLCSPEWRNYPLIHFLSLQPFYQYRRVQQGAWTGQLHWERNESQEMITPKRAPCWSALRLCPPFLLVLSVCLPVCLPVWLTYWFDRAVSFFLGAVTTFAGTGVVGFNDVGLILCSLFERREWEDEGPACLRAWCSAMLLLVFFPVSCACFFRALLVAHNSIIRFVLFLVASSVIFFFVFFLLFFGF